MNDQLETDDTDILDEKSIVTDLTKRAIDRILQFAEKRVVERWARQQNLTFESFTNYLEQKSLRCRQVKNLLQDSGNAQLEDLYVPARFLSGYVPITEIEFLQTLIGKNVSNLYRNAHAAIVRGAAGTGKSIFMKHAFLELQKLSKDRIPLLVELRSLNTRKLQNPNNPDVTEWVQILKNEISAYGKDIPTVQVEDALKHGLFVILLDGVDEIKPKIQSLYEKLILDLAKKYPDCPILIAGRPMAKMLSWQDFSVYQIAPLLLDETVSLVRKANIDQSTKDRFIDLITEELEPEYVVFLETPLLVLIMIITYSDSGKLSRVRHEFYEDAFNALWSRHDARKEGFERQKYTGLQKHEFLRLLNAFSTSSYIDNDIDMRASKFYQHFLLAKNITQIQVKDEQFRDDLLVSTCLMVEDGPFLKFSHRSFQEFFASQHIMKMADSDVRAAIDMIADRHETDQVIYFLHSHSPEVIERCWLMPKLNKFLERLKLTASSSVSSYIKASINATQSGNKPKQQEFLSIIRSLYNFSPTTLELLAIHDANRGMLESRKFSEPTIDKSVAALFKTDQANIFGLKKLLKDKYARSGEAARLLLKVH